jgi:hypothetical protein
MCVGRYLRLATLLLTGCAGIVESPPATRSSEDAAPSSLSPSLPPLDAAAFADSSASHGTCILHIVSSDAGAPDASLLVGSGTASWREIGIPGDINLSPGVRFECALLLAQLRLDVPDEAKGGLGRLQTAYGSAPCKLDLSAWPRNAPAAKGTFVCAPMKMTWGATLDVSGELSF